MVKVQNCIYRFARGEGLCFAVIQRSVSGVFWKEKEKKIVPVLNSINKKIVHLS